MFQKLPQGYFSRKLRFARANDATLRRTDAQVRFQKFYPNLVQPRPGRPFHAQISRALGEHFG